ncbi:MAG: tRNA guanosine(34) transglycosylase Tgt [Candidatus Woesearchaeota archaeon]
MNSFFKVIKESAESKARAGILKTDHTEIETPVFMPVGTQGAIKAIDHIFVSNIGAKIILSNTYHLYLRPGIDVISHFEGLHNFINWGGAILTDSGGYQIYSLQELRKVKDDGVEFRSHIDGSKHFFNPEKVIEIQRILGSDIIMVLDECTPYPSTYIETKKSMELSYQWAIKSKEYFLHNPKLYEHKQYLFCIGQGGIYKDLRKEHIEKNLELNFDGYAIGGLSVGEPLEIMNEIVDFSTDFLPKNKPRYLMGVGTPENILDAIERGIDMFDCVIPTRNARNAQLFTTKGKINIRNLKYKFSKEPIDENLDCYFSKNYCLGYLRHLFIANEILALQIATANNLAFYLWLVKKAREKILKNNFLDWKNKFLDNYIKNID